MRVARWRSLLGLVSLLCVMLGCQTEPGETTPRPEFDVSLSLEASALKVVGVAPAKALAVKPWAEHRLSWELLVDDKVLRSGEVPDTRWVRSEWDETGKPKSIVTKAQFATFGLRLPGVEGDLIVSEPDGAGRRELGRTRYVPPTPGTTSQPLLVRPGDVLGTTPIVGGGTGGVNIAILAEGYTEGELGQFHADAEAMAAALANHPSYAAFAGQLNIWRIDVRSRDTGIDDPNSGAVRDTAFDTSFGVGDNHRCIWFGTSAGASAARDLASSVGADFAAVIVNTPIYGGCAGGNLLTTYRGNPEVLAHELGHAVFGLADEYVEESRCGAYSPAPNVSPTFERETLPWSDMVDTNQLPTPDSAGPGVLGAYEGAQYCAHGRYRSAHNCLMRELGGPMCPICQREMQRVFSGAPGGGGHGGNGGGGGSGGEGGEGGDGCVGLQCTPTGCGNGVCAPGVEDSYTCPPDCPATCGNGVCDYQETHAECPSECNDFCGDGQCAPDVEDSYNCLSDCPQVCGNGMCDNGETCTECPSECPCAPGCGNGVCEPSESSYTCWGDCPAVCGNGTCDNGETQLGCPGECGAICGDNYCSPGVEGWASCPGDCPAVCGNGSCDGESCYACPGDCGACPAACGNGSCETGESCATCAQDCGTCAPGCGNGTCGAGETCGTCPTDCGTCSTPACGNGSCSGGETCSSCAADCGACPPTCGNGSCSGGETCNGCPQDCGACPSGCGDGVCAPYVEDSYNCLSDCPPVCGNGACDNGETNQACPGDCGPKCGDAYCTPGSEDSFNCLSDCPPVCNNGACDNGETCSSCQSDCGACGPSCGNGLCEEGEDCWCFDCGYCPP